MQDLSYEQRKVALIEEITKAFDGVSREDGVSLHEATVIDDYGTDEARAKARESDTETRWQDVPDEDIRFCNSELSFLDPKGFHYYIPAYVVWYLRYMDSEDPEFWSNTFDAIIYHLGSGLRGRRDDYFLAKYSLFTPLQSQAIAHFLVFEAEREDAYDIKAEKHRQESMLKEGFTQEEIDEAKKDGERYRIKVGLPKNHARHALERYWGQFL